MLKRTIDRTTGKGPAATFLPLLLMGVLLFGCGDDTPQRESDGSEDTDTPAIGPNDTIASSFPAQVPDSMPSAPAGSQAVTTATGGNVKTSPTSVSITTSSSTSSNPTLQRPATSTITSGRESAAAGETKPYDPAVFDALVHAHVSNGKVDYAEFKSSPEFAGFLQSLAAASPDAMSANEKLAFWINAYNALVIRNVNDNPGIRKPLDVPGFFDKKKFAVAGRQLTLNQIENEVIRPTFKEPLIHFGLVCAAISCPPLIPKAYTGSNVRGQLAANAKAYLGDAKQNRFDAATNTLYLSKIFEWYKEDFGGDDAGLIDFAKTYGPDGMKSALASAGDVRVKFNEYDWTLNKK